VATAIVIFLTAAAAQSAEHRPAPIASRGGTAGGSHCAKRFPPIIHDGFPEPRMYFSSDGRLDTTLRMANTPVRIAGQRYVTMAYNDQYPGPTLVICPGDRVHVHLINDLKPLLGVPQDTNLHVHGLHVSPSGDQDNVFLNIRPGRSFDYHYRIPLDQDAGMYWYHPHRHMFVNAQIFQGLVGSIVVEGGLDNVLPTVPQRLMVITTTEPCTRAGRSLAFDRRGTEPCTRPGQVLPPQESLSRYRALFVNGALNPTVKIRPGQIQRWRILNADNNRILVLHLQGQNLQVLAEDGNTLARMRPTANLTIGPGSRREVLVRGGPPGRYQVKSLRFAQFASGEPFPTERLLTVVSSGRRAHDRLPRGRLSRPVDLGSMHVDRRRVIVFSQMETPSKFSYYINHRMFDPNFVAVTMRLNSVEQWTLKNASAEWHTFHIHTNPFQVMSINGRRLPYVDYQDNVAMPPRSSIVIRMHPIDFTGKLVIHCHVASHEDLGMMAAVQVVRNPTPTEDQASAVSSGGFAISSSAYGSSTVPIALLSFYCHLLGQSIPRA
jgi:suppressor of ftsI